MPAPMRPAPRIFAAVMLAVLARMIPARAADTPAEPARHDPPLARGWLDSGALKWQTGDLDGALADFERAIASDAGLAEAYVMRGLCKDAQGDLDGAIADHDRALAIFPGLAPALANRGKARAAKGDLDSALADYDAAIAADPGMRAAYNNRGLARLARGNTIGALADFNTAMRPPAGAARGGGSGDGLRQGVSPYAPALLNRAAIRVMQEDFEEALRDVNAAVTAASNLGEDPGPAKLTRTLLQLRLNQGEPLSQLARESAGWKPGWTKTHAGFLTGDLTENDLLAEAKKSGGAAKGERVAEALYHAGVLRLLDGQPAAARELWEKSAAAAPRSATAAVVRAELARLPVPAPPPAAPVAR
jgi:tetratricopeptide (TPR) repeat protein